MLFQASKVVALFVLATARNHRAGSQWYPHSCLAFRRRRGS